ncbi:hypothetical protein PVAND_000873 [Polypedilum vanderplanki]|uniref:BTB domain-containing protein n=1 Tax=Polypedilum vanderplanki TaxID=319348 RepID=A0A9J6BL72_POLVA|nr:hypothetical protein PVAND_000873 [Polypedilum vanderplanki]
MTQQVHCKFENSTWTFLGNCYVCIIKDQILIESKRIVVKGKHLVGKSNKDVTAVSLNGCKLWEFPQGLNKMFRNMQAIHIFQTNLSRISREDLEEYKTLIHLHIGYNEILFLQEDLLTDMKSLQFFSVYEKNLLVIQPNIFNDLKRLKYIDFRQCNLVNFLYNSDGLGDCKSLEEVKKKLEEKYQDLPWKNFFEKMQKLEKDSELLKDLKNELYKENLKDFKVIVDKEEFNTHKIVLAARSPVFTEMIENNPDAESLNLVDVSPAIFHEIYNFMYTNEFPNFADINLVHLLIASEKLKIKKLSKFAANKLLNNITNENSFELMTLGKKYDYIELQEKAFAKIKEFFNDEQIDEALVNKPEKLKKLIDIKKEKIRCLAELEEKFKSVLNED